ncbi:MAG: hypothetical protein HY874_09610 [Chloroflexi bacterium]|nr:hypothetical protein [Chloroflexota bacterium]
MFVIAPDARGATVHVRSVATAECLGCIETSLYEIVRALVLGEETAARPQRGSIGWQQPSPTASVAPARERNDDEG